MSVNLDEAKNIRRMMEQIVRETVRSMPDFRNAFRTYKATVVTAPANRVCTVRLVGEDKTMTIPYSSYCEDVQVGDIVYVGVIANSLNNAFVFQRILLPENYGNPIEYLFYTKTAPTAKGSAIIDSMRGYSLVWNQLAQHPAFSGTATLEIEDIGNGTYMLHGTQSSLITRDCNTVNLKANHKYLYGAQASKSVGGQPHLLLRTSSGGQLEQANTLSIYSRTSDLSNVSLRIRISGGDFEGVTFTPICIDLTEMFGAGNEPTLEEFEKIFSLGYFTTNTGTLLSFDGTALNSLSLPISTYFPDGMHSNRNGVYDELTADAATQRLTVRAYEAGDESNPDYVTDGTNTIVPLATPIITPISPPLNLRYNITTGQTEAISPALSAAPSTTPMHAFIKYKL